MTKRKTLPLRMGVVVLMLAAGLVYPATAAELARFSGELGGLVVDTSGRPAPGATVLLFNKQARLLQTTKANSAGNFSFLDLLPDTYSIRVSVSNYLPAIRDRIVVRPGMRSLLEVSLSRLYSSIQLISTKPAPGGLMSEDWKWTLRTDSSRRPILRILPGTRQNGSGNYGLASLHDDGLKSALFSHSRGMIRVSASDGGPNLGSAYEADLGTQFAFATSVYGANHFQLSGNLGFTPGTNMPSTGFRTTFRRELSGGTPEVSVTMRQLSVPMRAGLALTGNPLSEGGVPSLRTFSASFADHAPLSDSLDFQYGFELDMVSFLSRLHYFSPYAKLSYSIPHGTVDLTWTSGNSRPELGLGGAADANVDLQRELTSLSMIPKVSLLDGRAKVQRGDNYEIGVTQRYGSRTYRVAAYHEVVSNAALALTTQGGSGLDLFTGDILPDLFSDSLAFNAGRIESEGVTASVTQDLAANYKVMLSVGSGGALTPRSTTMSGNTAADLRAILVSRQRPSATLRTSGTVKQTGTRFVTSYEWTDSKSAAPAQLYSTDMSRPEPGLNFYVRQPVPVFWGLPWRMEATAEFRNMLAQGYLTMCMPDGQRLILVPNPRSFRGGLAFVF